MKTFFGGTGFLAVSAGGTPVLLNFSFWFFREDFACILTI